MAKEKKGFKPVDLALVAMFAVVMAICSWIEIPMTVPFTLQTFAVYMALLCLGGKRGTMAVVVYLLLGVVGVPVFAGFSGGIGVIMGPTGGYLLGFVPVALLYWLFTAKKEKSVAWTAVICVAGLLLCYAFGTVWFYFVYAKTAEMGLWNMLMACVIPFILPDLAKIALAVFLSKSIRKRIKIGIVQ